MTDLQFDKIGLDQTRKFVVISMVVGSEAVESKLVKNWRPAKQCYFPRRRVFAGCKFGACFLPFTKVKQLFAHCFKILYWF